MIPSVSNQSVLRREVVNKAKALVEVMDEVMQSDEYVSIWHIAAIHGAVYGGKQWAKEFDALKQSIKDMEEKK